MGHQLFRFREFQVYRNAREFRRRIYRVCDPFPKAEVFGLTSQIRRAVNSILLNIAEGAARSSDIDFGRFLNQAATSLAEVVACLDIALDERYVTNAIHTELLRNAELLGSQLISFSATVRKKARSQKF